VDEWGRSMKYSIRASIALGLSEKNYRFAVANLILLKINNHSFLA
jgi:hypothetical protein